VTDALFFRPRGWCPGDIDSRDGSAGLRAAGHVLFVYSSPRVRTGRRGCALGGRFGLLGNVLNCVSAEDIASLVFIPLSPTAAGRAASVSSLALSETRRSPWRPGRSSPGRGAPQQRDSSTSWRPPFRPCANSAKLLLPRRRSLRVGARAVCRRVGSCGPCRRGCARGRVRRGGGLLLGVVGHGVS